MRKRSRLTGTFGTIIGILRVANIAVLGIAILALTATFVWATPLLEHLRGQYGPTGHAALLYIRVLMISSAPLAFIAERLFRALADVIGTLRRGEPFAAANAGRLRIIGWALLALQIVDAMLGLTIWWAKSEHMRVLDWTPSLTGWLGVLVAFVLAQVFAQGAALRADLEGTI